MSRDQSYQRTRFFIILVSLKIFFKLDFKHLKTTPFIFRARYYLLRRFFYGLATQDRGKLRTIHNTSVFYHQLPRHVPIYIYIIYVV